MVCSTWIVVSLAGGCSQAAVPCICVSFFGATQTVDLGRSGGVTWRGVTRSRLISGALGYILITYPFRFINER
jgi:hypothetical protein